MTPNDQPLLTIGQFRAACAICNAQLTVLTPGLGDYAQAKEHFERAGWKYRQGEAGHWGCPVCMPTAEKGE